jgi:hypothetical protein
MEEFEGTVRLAGDNGALQAIMLVGGDRLKVSTRQHEIGNWKLTDISSSLRDDECHITAEGEELVVSVSNPKRFAEAIGPHVSNPGDGSLLRGLTPNGEESMGLVGRLSAVIRTVPARWQIVGASAAVVLGLAMLAPQILIGVILLGALAALLVSGYGYMDPFTAVKLPGPLTPVVLLRIGLAGLITAIALAVLL